MMLRAKALDERITQKILSPSTKGSAAIDLRACIKHDILMFPMQEMFFPTGLAIAIPDDTVGLILPRSGLGCRDGIILGNSLGAADSDYRGELTVCLVNRKREGMPVVIKPMARIAQLIITNITKPEWVLVDELDDTERGAGGFGSTGVE